MHAASHARHASSIAAHRNSFNQNDSPKLITTLGDGDDSDEDEDEMGDPGFLFGGDDGRLTTLDEGLEEQTMPRTLAASVRPVATDTLSWVNRRISTVGRPLPAAEEIAELLDDAIVAESTSSSVSYEGAVRRVSANPGKRRRTSIAALRQATGNNDAGVASAADGRSAIEASQISPSRAPNSRRATKNGMLHPGEESEVDRLHRRAPRYSGIVPDSTVAQRQSLLRGSMTQRQSQRQSMMPKRTRTSTLRHPSSVSPHGGQNRGGPRASEVQRRSMIGSFMVKMNEISRTSKAGRMSAIGGALEIPDHEDANDHEAESDDDGMIQKAPISIEEKQNIETRVNAIIARKSKKMEARGNKEVTGSERAKANWAKLRTAHNVVTVFKSINDDHKTFGVHQDDTHIDWEDVMRQDLSEMPCYIFMPSAWYIIVWDLYEMLVLVFIAFYVPYRAVFVTPPLSLAWQWIEYLITATFVLTIFLNFTTAYFDHDSRLIFSPKAIAIKYMQGFFIIDLLSTIPWEHLGKNMESADAFSKLPRLLRFFRIARLFRLLKIHKIQVFVEHLETQFNVHQGFSRLFSITFLVLIVTHCVGCLWFAIGNATSEVDDDVECYAADDDEWDVAPLCSWVQLHGLVASSNYDQYVASLYWALSTLTTVGYGDISATTPGEQVFAMLMMMTGVSWYAYIVSSISTIMSSFENNSKKVREKMMSVAGFVRDNQLPPELARRIRSFFTHMYNTSNRMRMMQEFDASEIFRNLSSQLRCEVIMHVERATIVNIPFLRNKTQQFISDVLVMLTPLNVPAGQLIIKEGSKADDMFFIVKGRAAAMHNGQRQKALVEGSYFGEIGCIMGGQRRASVIAITNCDLQVCASWG